MYVFSPNQVHAVVQGILTDRTEKTNTFLQGFFSTERTTDKPVISFDRDFNIRNVISEFVAPRVDAAEIQLRGYDTVYQEFAYTKEAWSSADYEDLLYRLPGAQFGDVASPMVQDALQLQQKAALAYKARENLFEWVAGQLLVTGGYTAKSERHQTIKYTFGRVPLVDSSAASSAAVEAILDNDRVSQVDLTTLTVNGGAGKRAWGSTGGTNAVSPVSDVTKMVQGALIGSGTEAIIMSGNAYDLYRKDPLIAASADLTKLIADRMTLEILPRIKNIEGLTLMSYHPVGGSGIVVPIYVYNAIYENRTTGVTTKFFPDGYVVAVPSPSYGMKVYGRILNRKANYATMPIWINTWNDQKTGHDQFEMHTNFLFGHTKIQDVISWKVC